MKTGKISDVRVPNEGPDSARIMCVAESPGETEVRERRPLVGMSGQQLNYYLERAGSPREETFVANLSQFRPNRNNFKLLISSIGKDSVEVGPVLAECIDLLIEDILRVDPEIIIALGNWPMFFLTGKFSPKQGSSGGPGTGIGNHRGSIWPCTLVPGYKVYCSHHPAFLLRAHKWKVIFADDLKRAVTDIETYGREIVRPQYESYIDPPGDILNHLSTEFANAEWLSIDIETFPDRTMSCFGVSDGDQRALCMTFNRSETWEVAEMLLACPAKKIMQFGTYDVNFLHRFYSWKTENLYWDTLIASATLLPEFPRKLDFLTSIYTRFPYYKEERKEWKMTGDMNILWEYNLKDVIATYQIAMVQLQAMEERFPGVDARTFRVPIRI